MTEIVVEVLKTNVNNVEDAFIIIQMLRNIYPTHKINFDLEDCDRILRIEGKRIDITKVNLLLQEKGFECNRLDD